MHDQTSAIQLPIILNNYYSLLYCDMISLMISVCMLLFIFFVIFSPFCCRLIFKNIGCSLIPIKCVTFNKYFIADV